MRSAHKYLCALLLVALACVALCLLTGSADARTATWDGGGADNLASTAANWDLDTAPIAGDDLLWNAGSKACTIDISAAFNNLTMASGYTGIITHSTSFSGNYFTLSSGTLTPTTTLPITLTGFIKTGGTLTTNKLALITSGQSCVITMNHNDYQTFYSLRISGNTTFSTLYYNGVGSSFIVDAGRFISINSGDALVLQGAAVIGAMQNNGDIRGLGTFELMLGSSSGNLGNIGIITCPVKISQISSASGSATLTMTVDVLLVNDLTIEDYHATYKVTLDVNDKNLIVDDLKVLAKGILVCGSGTITASSLDSSLGTVTNENATWVFTNNALIKMAAGGTLYDVEVNGTSLRLGSDVSMNSLVFLGLTVSHPYGWYENGTRVSSIASDVNGTYSLGSGVFAWDNATLKITPVITTDLWQHTDTFRNSIWQGYDYWADHDCDLLVTWRIVASEDWLTIDDTGNITGTPNEDGACYYTITVTYSNGETATVSGYVDVVTSATQSASMAVSSLLGALVLVLIVSTVIVMINRSQRS